LFNSYFAQSPTWKRGITILKVNPQCPCRAEYCIQTEAAYACVEVLRDREVMMRLIMCGERTLDENLSQVLILEGAKEQPGSQQG
jgi:hypothetical protein